MHLLTFLPFVPLISAQVSFPIAQNPAVRSAQLEQRSLVLRGLKSRQSSDTVLADLGNALNAGLYYANISVGTPFQDLMVQIDTGSSDTWVPYAGARICTSQREGGCPGGSFSPDSSSTFNVVGQDEFNISYVDGTGVTGDYFTDAFGIGGASLKNFQMGIATAGTIGVGIMGIGYNNSVANVFTGDGRVYANLPDALVDAGAIKTTAYSLWLNDLQSSEGEILFGGIDTAKYTGDLISIRVYPSRGSDEVTSFTVALTSLSATSSSGTDQLTPPDYAIAAILDSGTTITLLPDDLADAVFQEVGAVYSRSLGAMVVPCALSNNNGTLNYGFGGAGGPVIKVAVSDLILPLVLSSGRRPQFTDGTEACQLGIQGAGSAPVLLGDTFLRSAYAVYDLYNNRIALAQTDFNSTDSNVVAFASEGAQIPSAVYASNTKVVEQTATGIPRVEVTSRVSGDASATEATYNPTATGLNAASGFQATATSASTTKKSVAGSGPQPFMWSQVVVAVIALLGAGLGGGLFAIL